MLPLVVTVYNHDAGLCHFFLNKARFCGAIGFGLRGLAFNVFVCNGRFGVQN